MDLRVENVAGWGFEVKKVAGGVKREEGVPDSGLEEERGGGSSMVPTGRRR